MGQDMHFRCFLKVKNSGNYINAHDLCEWDPTGTTFTDLVPGRSYDFFSLFGSRLGAYKELGRANYGIPGFLVGSVFDKYCKINGYYGFIWWKLSDFRLAVSEYADEIMDPMRYLNDDDETKNDIQELLKPGKKTKTQQKELAESFSKWVYSCRNIINQLNELKAALERYDLLKKDYSGLNTLVDIDETIFLFFFDS